MSALHDYDVKPPNLTFYGGRGHTTTNSPFSFWTWIKSLRIQFERTQIYFLRRFQCRCRRLCLSSLIGTLRSNNATATRTSLKKVCLRSFSLYSDYSYKNFVKCRRTLLKLNFKGPYPSSEREIKFRRCLFTSSIKHEIRHFHVVVVQKRERNVQKKCDARAKLLFCL